MEALHLTLLLFNLQLFEATYNDVMYLQRIGQFVTTNPWKPYERRNDLLCYHNRAVIPPQSTLTAQLLHEHHDTPMGGHS